MLDAFWRACLSCWHPRVLLWTLAPLLLAVSLVGGLGWFYWEPALDGVRALLDSVPWAQQALRWLDDLGGRHLRVLVAPIVVVGLTMPLVLLVTFLLVVLLAVPALARHVAAYRCRDLTAVQQGAQNTSRGRAVSWTLLCALVALLALALSVPLWLVPPLALLLPPLIWGWLVSRVLPYTVLATFASTAERRLLLHRHRWPLWGAGLVCGCVASLPSLVWVAGTPALVAAPVLAPVMAWAYTAVFVFSALWCAHFLLPLLSGLRRPPGRTSQALDAHPIPATSPGTSVSSSLATKSFLANARTNTCPS